MTSETKHYHREFLNKKEGTAFIENSISESSSADTEAQHQWLDLDAYLKIADCYRHITLEFCEFGVTLDQLNEYTDNNLHKIQILRQQLEVIEEEILRFHDKKVKFLKEQKQSQEQ